MSEGLIPRRYAKALYKFALEKSATRRVYDLMLTLEKSFEDAPSLQEVMDNPFVPVKDKIALLTTASGATPKDLVLEDFFKLLDHNHRFPMVRSIALAYRLLYREENHIYEVKVTSAAPLADGEEKRLKDFILNHLKGGTMEYSSAVDPDLIGGFVIKINNELLDASISNELNQLRLKLLSK